MTTLDAASLTHWQSCRRRYVLERDWSPRRWLPGVLYTACLRAGVLQLSSGMAVADAAKLARARYMNEASSPGLDVTGKVNVYALAKDYCALLDTTLRGLAMTQIPALCEAPEVTLSPSVRWRFLSHPDAGGTLHRWLTVGRMTEAVLTRELHSWHVMGDIACSSQSMTLHVLELGSRRAGRYSSPWAQAYRHPGIAALKLRFRGKDKKTLAGWNPVWLADLPAYSPEQWVKTAWDEGVLQPLLHTFHVAAPEEAVLADTVRQIVSEAECARDLTECTESWSQVPMSRGACDDVLGPCPFQQVCYHRGHVDVAALGLYRRREQETKSPACTTSPVD